MGATRPGYTGRTDENHYGVYNRGDWATGAIIEEDDLDTIESGIYYIDQEIHEARGSEDTLSDKIESIELDIADIKYESIEIKSFSITTPASGLAETGSTLSSVTFKWELSKEPTILNIISNGNKVADLSLNKTGTYNLSGTVTNSTSYVLHAFDAGLPSEKSAYETTKTINLNFYNRIYYGVAAAQSTPNSAFITGLANKPISNDKARNFTINVPSNQYIWYAVPTRLGACNFNIGSFDGGFNAPATIEVTNSSGYRENYYLYRSTNANLGNDVKIIVS